MPVTVILVLLFTSSSYAAEGKAVLYSALFPGWGQFRVGHYGRGALFLGTEIVALTSLIIADIQYERAVEQYRRERGYYLTSTYIGDAEEHYLNMQEKWNSAEDLHVYRNVLAGAAAGIWAASMIDIIMNGGDREPPLSLEIKGNGFFVTRTFSF